MIRQTTLIATATALMFSGSGCTEPSAPVSRGAFEAELQGPVEVQLRGNAGFAQTDTAELIAFYIGLSKTIRDTTFHITLHYPGSRPPRGVYGALGGPAADPDFHLSVSICNDPGRWCSGYMPIDGLINLTLSSPTKVSGVFNAVVKYPDPNIPQQIVLDGTFDAVCDTTLLRPLEAFCR